MAHSPVVMSLVVLPLGSSDILGALMTRNELCRKQTMPEYLLELVSLKDLKE
jgi:hypothetical protein